ncbi:SpoIID/LytB domain-containing protein [Prochlorococcus marinus]|uniref:SpoIID/LytB domain-containing protein n=1 Tax=Prochlorococcus marinus TaxID=1219 RepID=UPI000517433A|nr:SpoIID/LytB domain-containing protein [Prochlorococcus marinus]KGF91613.1 putative sporulation protein SpoIID [Prochlorococcus marinus str. MIT 9107]
MKFKYIKITHNYFLIFILNFCVFQTRPLLASRIPTIRVLISKNKKIRIRADRAIPLTVEGQKFSNKKFKGLTLKMESNRKFMFFDNNKQKIYDLKNKDKFVIKTSDLRGIWVGQKRYAGKLKIFVIDNEILVVNVLGVENYLSSVVGSEMPTKWPIEALKAQAIASRTYALKQKGNAQYDIDSTNKNQVYSGLEARTYKTTKAVNSTKALVLVYKNKLINSLFHSSSAGMTENSQDVWENEYPYLSSVKDFDKNNPKLRWQKRFSNKQLQKLFPKIGGIKQIEILKITDTGRVQNVKIQGDYGSDQISGVNIRKRLNLKSTLVRFKLTEDNGTKSDNENNKLLSTTLLEDKPLTHIVKPGDSLFDIADQYKVSFHEIVTFNNIKDPSVININQKLLIPRNPGNNLPNVEKILVVSGYGSGHGVGMSQWGAKYMATKGAKAKAILKHFYRGVKIKPFKRYFL